MGFSIFSLSNKIKNHFTYLSKSCVTKNLICTKSSSCQCNHYGRWFFSWRLCLRVENWLTKRRDFKFWKTTEMFWAFKEKLSRIIWDDQNLCLVDLIIGYTEFLLRPPIKPNNLAPKSQRLMTFWRDKHRPVWAGDEHKWDRDKDRWICVRLAVWTGWYSSG